MTKRSASARFWGSALAERRTASSSANGACHAALFGIAKFLDVADRRAARNIDVMPRRRIGPQRANVVGPCGGIRHCIDRDWLAVPAEARIDGPISQNFLGHRQRVRREVLFGQQRDRLGVLRSPTRARGRAGLSQQILKGQQKSRRAATLFASNRGAAGKWKVDGKWTTASLRRRTSFFLLYQFNGRGIDAVALARSVVGRRGKRGRGARRSGCTALPRASSRG